MIKNEFKITTQFYKNILGDIFVLVLSVMGGYVATNFDILNLRSILDLNVVFSLYTFIFIALSFPIILFFTLLGSFIRNKTIKRKQNISFEKLRIADGMPREAIWYEYEEHSLTIINETGYDLKKCYILLDELAWKNFNNRWEVVIKDVFSMPFTWNKKGINGKIDIDDGERASFTVISHNEYSIYNSSKKKNEIHTDFDFIFFGNERYSIGYGSDIRMQISVRSKDTNDKSFEPQKFLIYVHLLQPHGIPKVDVVKVERI